MAYTCYSCGKIIRGKMTYIVPPTLLVQLCGDFPKAYHPRCYEASEKQAEQELKSGR